MLTFLFEEIPYVMHFTIMSIKREGEINYKQPYTEK